MPVYNGILKVPNAWLVGIPCRVQCLLSCHFSLPGPFRPWSGGLGSVDGPQEAPLRAENVGKSGDNRTTLPIRNMWNCVKVVFTVFQTAFVCSVELLEIWRLSKKYWKYPVDKSRVRLLVHVLKTSALEWLVLHTDNLFLLFGLNGMWALQVHSTRLHR